MHTYIKLAINKIGSFIDGENRFHQLIITRKMEESGGIEPQGFYALR